MAKAPAKDKTGLLLDIRNLRIEATSYPPGEAPRNVVIVDNVSVKVERGKVLAEELDKALAGGDPGKRDPSTLHLVQRSRG